MFPHIAALCCVMFRILSLLPSLLSLGVTFFSIFWSIFHWFSDESLASHHNNCQCVYITASCWSNSILFREYFQSTKIKLNELMYPCTWCTIHCSREIYSASFELTWKRKCFMYSSVLGRVQMKILNIISVSFSLKK